MNRYFLYLVVIFFIAATSVQQFVLLYAAYRGSLMSILLGFLAGTLIMIGAARLFARFPKQGFPEIVNGWLPRPLAVPFLLVQSALWFLTGIFPLLYMSEVAKRYVNPDFATNEPLALFLAVIVLLVNLPSNKHLYFLEIVLVLTVPLFIILCFKAYFSDQIMSFSMLEAASRIFEPPTYGAFCAVSLLFSGCLAMTVFNRVIAPDVLKVRYLLLLSVACLAFLLTAYFIPIGLFGADGVVHINYVWFATADNLRMQYGFIDRVLFITLPLNILTTLVFVVMTWHVGLEHWKAAWGSVRPGWGSVITAYLPIAGLSLLLFFVENQLGFTRVTHFAMYWNWGHVPNTLVVILLLWLAASRASRKKRKEAQG